MKTPPPQLLLLLLAPRTWAKIPDAELYVNNIHYPATYGYFGSRASLEGLTLASTPDKDVKLCGNDTTTDTLVEPGSIMLVPRGECSFQYKLARSLLMGASGVIIYNTLESRYDWNGTAVVYPTPKEDYDCDLGTIVVENASFALDPPAYKGSVHDKYLSQDSPDNLCLLPNNDCASGRCLIASKEADSDFQACCAWDIHIGMNRDSRLPGSYDVGIAVFVTMAQADELLLQIGSPVSVNARYYPSFNLSNFFIWWLAVCIAAFASWNSASEYRRARYKLTHPEESTRDIEMTPTTHVAVPGPRIITMRDDQAPLQNSSDIAMTPTAEQSLNDDQLAPEQQPQEHPNPIDSREATVEPDVAPQTTEIHLATGQHSTPQNSQPISQQTVPTDHEQPSRRSQPAAPSMELTLWHAATFVVVASALLLLLFFFQFYTAVTVLYGIACSGAMAQLIFHPLFAKVALWLGYSNWVSTALCPKVVFCGCNDITVLDVFASLAGYSIGASWIYVWFTSSDPSQNAFYWITQNVMGACICILFLNTLRLNSIKVATVLLIAVFIYDIFFVFLSPYFFGGESVMVTVATTGGPAAVSADYCEKYPSDSQCKEGQPLPMLLTIPRINDYRGGSSLLGLGDIVLPGLLISFAARLDEAKRLVGGHTSFQIRMPPQFGFFGYVIVAYAIGLLLAIIAVVVMQRGQPALLYLVPATLGTFLVLGRHELKDLWKGPHVLLWADRLVRYCDTHTIYATGDAVTLAESIDDLELEEEEESPAANVVEPGARREGTTMSSQDNRSAREII